MTFVAGQTLTAAALNALPRIIARGRRTSNSSGATVTGVDVGVLRLDDIPVTGGHAYAVWTSNLALDTTVANDDAMAQIRHTTDGSTPTTSSTVLPGAHVRDHLVSATNGTIVAINSIYVPAADETLSLLLCIQRQAGTGTVTIIGSAEFTIDLVVADLGEDPGDTGVDV